MKLKIVVLSIVCLALSACATTGVTVVDRNTPVANPVNKPAPMNLGQVEWRVLDLAALKTLVAELELRGDKSSVVYVMDKSSYEVLSMNLAEMKRYIADKTAEASQLREAIDINAGKKAEPVVAKKKKRFGLF